MAEEKPETGKPEEPAAEPQKPEPSKPAAAKPAAPAPRREEPPKPTPLANELVNRLRARFSADIGEATLDRKQAIVVVSKDRLLEVCEYLKAEEKFDFLADLTAVDWYKREKRFDVVSNLYSFPKNERLRLKVQVADGESVPSVVAFWSAANWLERECYDMFGIHFAGHPDLKRILLPEEWQGFPLRKDYDIIKQDTAWVKENLHIESGQ